MNRNLRISCSALLPLALLGFASTALARSPHGCLPHAQRTIAPIVSTEWLYDNLGAGDLVVVDVRPADTYADGHIPGAISEPFVVPYSAWITMRDGLLLEVPDDAELFGAIGSLGIMADSRVVVVSDPNPGEPPGYGLSAATRVADTLIYAGIRDVAILDGGHSKWMTDGFEGTTVDPIAEPVVYRGRVDEDMFVTKAYVEDRIGRAVIIDARDADVYFGVALEPFAPVAGHIPTAHSLPSPWVWFEDGTYDDAEVLGAMAGGVVGHKQNREVIVYCGVGGYASTWWFLLTQVLGYTNVKFYDGAAQDWVATNAMVPYRWE